MTDQQKARSFSRHRAWPRRCSDRIGFTLIEMLITIVIIALLVSLVAVTGGRVRALAENKQTRQQLVSIKSGLTQFKEIYGYYPPLLSDRPNNTFLSVVDDDNGSEDDPQIARRGIQYYSTLTLVPYLIGVGDLNGDQDPLPWSEGDNAGDESDDNVYDDGQPGEGFRDPGPDRSWGGAERADNRTEYWDRYVQTNQLKGKVTKQLIELDESLQPALDRRGEKIEDYYLFQIVDTWDTPIRYYRGWYASETETDDDDGLPVNWPREWFESVPQNERASLVQSLRSAPFVLMSAGRDQLARPEELDGEEAEAEDDVDNIIELGDA